MKGLPEIGADYAVLATGAVSAANIPIKYLGVQGLKLDDLANEFRDTVVKYKQLETLFLRSSVIPLHHIFETRKQCSERSTLRTYVPVVPTQENILKIIRLSKNLQVRHIRVDAHPGEKSALASTST